MSDCYCSALNTIPLIFDEKQHQTVQWNNTIIRPLARKQCGQTIKAVEDKKPNIKGISHRTVGCNWGLHRDPYWKDKRTIAITSMTKLAEILLSKPCKS